MKFGNRGTLVDPDDDINRASFGYDRFWDFRSAGGQGSKMATSYT
jgi:hypothetical protein